MRASELLASRVVDRHGRDLGPVRDVRVRCEAAGRYRIVAVVIGDGRFAAVAHALGVAEGRVQAPWLLRRLCAAAVRRTRVVAAEHVVDWGPTTIRIAVGDDELPQLGGP